MKTIQKTFKTLKALNLFLAILFSFFTLNFFIMACYFARTCKTEQCGIVLFFAVVSSFIIYQVTRK